jgi:colicin import membrane protein
MNGSQTFQFNHAPFKRARLTKKESTKRAFGFSLIAHLGLLAFLMIGISWNNSTPSGVEVELWDSVPQVQTSPEPEMKTVVKEEAAEIAVQKKQVEKEPPKKEVVKESSKTVKPPPAKEKEKEPPKKVESLKALSPAETKANAAAEKVRADQLARLRAAAGAEGGSGGTVGSGVGGGSAPPGWTDKVIKKVRPLIVFNPESVSGNPAAVIQVSLAPDGAILSTSILSSSGNSSWDRAVLLALSRAESLPKDDNGKIPQREVKLTFKPKD